MFRIDVHVMFAIKMFVVFAPAERSCLSAVLSHLRIRVLVCVDNWVTPVLGVLFVEKKSHRIHG